MPRILGPVESSENALRAVEHTVLLANTNAALTCVLLYVRAPYGARVHAYRSHEQVLTMETDEAEAALLPAQKILDAAGTPYAAASQEGDIAHLIVAHAKQAQCNLIAMGMRGMGIVPGPVSMDSVTSKVLHTTDVPVTLVK